MAGKVALAATWRPRGELKRLERMLPLIATEYPWLAIILPPDAHAEASQLDEIIGGFYEPEDFRVSVVAEWPRGRYQALVDALGWREAQYVQYADTDRLLRWIETKPQEWRQALAAMPEWDCLVYTRSAVAYATHPQALVQTEQISNRVISYLIGQELDASAGAKGFSRAAAEYLVEHSSPAPALGTDGDWLVTLRRAGFRIGQYAVDGLDWETADRYSDAAADPESQRQAAQDYDAVPEHWQMRLDVAAEIVESGLAAARRPLPAPDAAFDFRAVFEVDDYLHFYADSLTSEFTDRQVEFLVRELDLDRPVDILDLACGFGRHANRLAALGHRVTGVDNSIGFLELARQDAAAQELPVEYRLGDMRSIDYREQFDVVLLLFTSFGYFDDAENLKVLQNVASALRPGGRFVMDIMDRDTFLKSFLPYIVIEKDGDIQIDRLSFDRQSGKLVNRRIVIRRGVRSDKPYAVRLYNMNEMETVLQSVGLQLIKCYGDWEGSPVSMNTRRLVLFASKPGEPNREYSVSS